MSNLTVYEQNTDYRTILVKANEPRRLLAALLMDLPNVLHINYPEGDQGRQIELLIDFILAQYPTISTAEIHKAFELNDGQKFTRHVQSFGRIDRAFIGAVLGEYIVWRIRQRQPSNGASEVEKDASKLLFHDLTTLARSPGFCISQDIELKFNWLAKNEKGFNKEIDQTKFQQYTKEYERNIKEGEYIWLRHEEINEATRAEGFALDKLQAEMITDFLKQKINQLKEKK